MSIHLIYKDYNESIFYPHIDNLLSKLLELYDDGDIPSHIIACDAVTGLVDNDELRELLRDYKEENEADRRHEDSLVAGGEKC